MERGTAGDQQSNHDHRCQEFGDERRRVDDLLEIVEHQQSAAIGARDACALRQITLRDV
jgi:hypothetical protein